MMADEPHQEEEWRVETDLLRTFTAVVRTESFTAGLHRRCYLARGSADGARARMSSTAA